MELEYVLKAVRRFWPVVVAFVLLGIVGSYVVKPNTTPRYESAALVLVVPPANSSQAAGQGDRYVASQLVIMRSPPIAERATELAEVGTISSEDVTFTQIAGTDVVRVIASATTPTSAQAVANAYVTAYLERSAADSGSASPDEPTKLETSLAEVEQQLSDVDQQIQDAMQPYTDASADDPQVSLPGIEQVAPALATQREVLLDTYRSLLQQRNALEFDPASQNTGSQIVQSASLPLAPAAQSRRVWTLALPLLGLLSGIAVATLLARLSRHVLDDVEVSEELGLPFAGQVPYKPALAHEGLLRVGSLPHDYDEQVSALCVQVEARAQLDTALTIAVSGAQRVSGATTLAAAMAARFGQLGMTVLLVDLDLEQPTVSRHFGIRNDGISALLQLDPEATSSSRRSRAFVSTPWANVRVVGRQPGMANGRPQRADVLNVMRTASHYADVVIVDTGPMLVAPAAAVLAHHAQVVVMTIPVSRQERVALERIALQLAPVQGNVLPVETPALRHSIVRRLLNRARPSKAPNAAQTETETEPVPAASTPRRRRTDAAKAAADDDGTRRRPAAG